MDRRAPGESGLKVRLLSVGKERSDPLAAVVQDYADRISHYARFDLVEVKASQRRSPADARREESDAILARLKERERLAALDATGKMLDSRELAALVERIQNEGQDILFAIGGDEGLAPDVLARADWVLSLSRFTLPHRLARLVLIEQLYRSFTLLRGEPYHK